MKLQLVKDSQDVSLLIFIQDSASTSGAGKTGLAYNTASLVCYYARPGVAAAALSLVTQTVTGAHSDGGFVEIDATNMPGLYRLDLSDAICATGKDSAVVMLKGASGMAPLTLEIQLTDFNLNSANPDVNVKQISGDSTAADNAESFFDGTGYAGTGNTIPTVTTLTSAPSDSSGVTTLLSRIVGTLLTGNHTAQSGDAYAQTNSGTYGLAALKILIDVIDDYVDTEIAAVKAKTDTIPVSPATEATLAIIAGYIDTEVAAIKAKTDLIPASPATEAKQDVIIGYIDTEVAAISGYIDTEVATIKAKTDLIPAAPAAVGDIPTTGAIKTAIEAAGSHLALILEDTGTTIPTSVSTINTTVDLIEDIVRNKLEITDANGNLVLYADDSSTPIYSVAAAITNDSTTTTRKRLV